MVSEICDDQTGSNANFNATDVTTPTVGADESKFVSWTCYFSEN
jgi:hypothetical protein